MLFELRAVLRGQYRPGRLCSNHRL